MNDSVFLAEFYGPTLSWFRPIMGLMGMLSFLGNVLLVWISLTTPSIRSVNSNWFVISMGISDVLGGIFTSPLCNISFSCGSDGSCPILVKITGAFCVSTIESSLVFPTFIVMNRYIKVTTLPSNNSDLRRFLISSRGVIVLCGCAWTYVISMSVILGIYDQLGEDLMGVYCAKRFKSFPLYLIYLTGGMYAILSTVATSYFYHKLQKFVTANLKKVDVNRVVKKDAIRTKQEDRQESDTRAVMKMVKLATLLPLVLQSGVYLLNGFQWFIPEDLLPMWGRRLLSVSFVIVPMCVPWVSLLILGPYKRELKRRFSATLRIATSVSAVSSPN